MDKRSLVLGIAVALAGCSAEARPASPAAEIAQHYADTPSRPRVEVLRECPPPADGRAPAECVDLVDVQY